MPLVCRLNAVSSSVSGPSVSGEGSREIRSCLIFARVAAANSSVSMANFAAFSSSMLAEKCESSSSAGMFVWTKLR